MNPLVQLMECGQSYWLDNLTRAMIMSGDLKRRVSEEGLRGVTSNPAIFHKAIAGSEDYDAQIRELAAAGKDVAEIYERLVVTDVRDACDVLRPVYDASQGVDGFVSLEVSPHLAHDTEGTMLEARRLFQAVRRPNLLIKIPGTLEGIPAVEEMLYEGMNINITLLFAIGRYEAVAEAYMRAFERRLAQGKGVDRVASVASFFLSRIDVLTDELLGELMKKKANPSAERLLGRFANANAKLAYQSFKGMVAGKRWRGLEERGARVQRLLWASTSTKNPRYSDVYYVEPLVGAHTVNTMPNETIAAFADHGRVVKDAVESGVDEARQVLADLRKLGIDPDRVTDQLLREGVQKFIEPFDKLLGTLAEKRRKILGGKEH
jgi:transaldolase